MLSRRVKIEKDQVIKCKYDANGYAIEMANASPIWDIRFYKVEFPSIDSEVAELTANMITNSVYIECNVNGND